MPPTTAVKTAIAQTKPGADPRECGNCAAWDPSMSAEATVGFCRRKAPIALAPTAKPLDFTFVGAPIWPLVHAGEFCLEHVPGRRSFHPSELAAPAVHEQ